MALTRNKINSLKPQKTSLFKEEEKDEPAPVYTVEKSLKSVNSDEIYAHASKCARELNWNDAVKLYQRAAHMGHRDAIFYLGLCYESGLGFEKKSPSDAAKLFHHASVLGSGPAYRKLGEIAESQNNADAVKNYLKACELNDSEAMYRLGLLYMNGNLVDKNEELAKEKFSQVISFSKDKVVRDQALENIKILNGGISRSVSPVSSVSKSMNELLVSNSTKPILEAAFCYLRGMNGFEINYANALELFQKAAAMNDPNAMLGIARIYMDGKGVDVNVPVAFEWLQKAEQLIPDSPSLLEGMLRCSERGVEMSKEKIAEYKRKLRSVQAHRSTR